MKISYSAAWLTLARASQHRARVTTTRRRRARSITGDLLARTPHADETCAGRQLEGLERVDAIVAVGRNVQQASKAAFDHELVDHTPLERDIGQQALVIVGADRVVLQLDRAPEHEIAIEVPRLST